MSDLSQQIQEIEKEIRETPYHKGTEHHIGKLRARLARLKDRQLEISIKKGGGGGFAVRKEGDATIVLVGPPSCGKSTLLNRLTNAESKVAPYAFTTVSVIPGMMLFKNAYIQILDIPGLIEGAKEGKGRGREVLSVARGADLLLVMTDIKRVDLLDKMISELEGAGIQINQDPPDVIVEKKVSGGIIIHSNIKQEIDKETFKEVAFEFGIKNAEITIKEALTMERLIDSFSANRVYLPAILAVNKVDELRRPKEEPANNYSYISAQEGNGVEALKEKIWEKLRLVRVFLVRPGEEPGFDNPIIMREGTILRNVSEKIGGEFAGRVKFAKIWGARARFPGQEVSLSFKAKEGLQVRFIS